MSNINYAENSANVRMRPPVPKGKPADSIVMPSSEEQAAQRGAPIAIGGLFIQPSDGFQIKYVVKDADGRILRGDGAVAAIYAELRGLQVNSARTTGIADKSYERT